MVRLIVRLIVSVGLVSFLGFFTDSTRLIKNIQQLEELTEIQKKFSEHINSRTLDNKEDKQFFPT